MRYWRDVWVMIILGAFWVSAVTAEEYPLQYYLAKATSKNYELSTEEKAGLLGRLEGVWGQVQQAHKRMIQTILTGELDIRYQEGRYWMSKLGEDQDAIDAGREQLKALKENSTRLVPAIVLYKSMKDLSLNFNAYNNMPAFSGFVGDLAPEMELWGDPIFYTLYLLPLAELRDKETESKPNPKEKKTTDSKQKTPPKGSKD